MEQRLQRTGERPTLIPTVSNASRSDWNVGALETQLTCRPELLDCPAIAGFRILDHDALLLARDLIGELQGVVAPKRIRTRLTLRTLEADEEPGHGGENIQMLGKFSPSDG